MLSKTLVKYIQNLSRKKFRDDEKRFIAEGPKVVQELLDAVPGNLANLFATRKWLDENRSSLGKTAKDLIHEITEEDLSRISSLTTANAVLAIFKQLDEVTNPDTKGKISLMLDGIQDPGNFGTIIRIADWFGVKHIICSEDCVDMYNPKVIQSTMGSITRVSVTYTKLTEWLQEQKSPTYAAVLNGDNIFDGKPVPEGIVIIGNESKGISSEIAAMASHKISIPRTGKAESLNAAVATGIILSQMIAKK